jgi:hypothetical protein
MIYRIWFLFCQPFEYLNRKPLKKSILLLLSGTLFLASCSKDEFVIDPIVDMPVQNMPVPCIAQTVNPAGRAYDTDSILNVNCTESHCGLIPLNAKNYWVYEDSVFNYGTFLRVEYDTLRYRGIRRSLYDGLVWWESTADLGIPQMLYANDSALFALKQRAYTPDYVDAKKDYSLFPGDSIRYLASFDDIAAQGRSIRMKSTYAVPAGEFDGYFYFEKNARNYRKDRIYFKPGIGVLKYIIEEAQMGTFQIKLQHIKTLVNYHIE